MSLAASISARSATANNASMRWMTTAASRTRTSASPGTDDRLGGTRMPCAVSRASCCARRCSAFGGYGTCASSSMAGSPWLISTRPCGSRMLPSARKHTALACSAHCASAPNAASSTSKVKCCRTRCTCRIRW
ncbi:hypothetical protein BXOR1_15525 [Xanthomonas oryzae pv. oryzicola]|nr:hypothetical protein BE73_00275 [Xanthomonas oryzae pv. oryzicola]KOR46868.1 hypothetical protein ADT27_09710 [Xanthomonas oryzae]AKK65813.1 hypothetical protein FE36_19585 [Xanthomonas oryzae pv. oryzicola]AKN99210.1 hypothetical protein ACU15_00225 [Xanthomonas oryzae pv. oryzicola]AKO02867.1 hypothetical protein ACU16_00245 [Xanthomonas oryzae pv. oryzicola]